jgi:hypothetical protein
MKKISLKIWMTIGATLMSSVSFATPIEDRNLQTTSEAFTVWMTYKDSQGATEQEGLDKLASFFIEESTWTLNEDRRFGIPFAGKHQGPEGVKRFAKGHWDTLQAEYGPPRYFIAQGNFVLTAGDADTTVRRNGCKTHLTVVHEFEFYPESGKIKSLEVYYTTSALAKAYRHEGRCKT